MADKRKKNEKPEAEAVETPEIKQQAATDAKAEAPGAAPEEAGARPEHAEGDTPEPTATSDMETPEDQADAEHEEPQEAAQADKTDTAAPPVTPLPVVAPEPVVIRKGGFVPLFLGGIAAAAIGFGAALYVFPEGWPGADDSAFEAEVTGKLEAQSKALADLQAEAGKAPDFTPLQDDIAGVQTALDTLAGQLGSASTRLDGLDTRLTELEKRPLTESVSPAAIAAYEREMKALQEAMAAQRAEIEKIAAEAASKEASAEITAQQAMQRAALSRILTALDTGSGFADAAAQLQAAGIALPPELAQVAGDGVATRGDLAQDFPEAARAALSVARKSGEGSGIGTFLKTQLGARSLEPREGNDPDAVLSRAEAAINEGRLTDAMAELDALPEAARAEMTDWLSRAATRAAALKAADALASELN